MGNQKQIVFSLWFVAAAIANSYSQDSFNIHFGRSIPMSDFSFQSIGFGSTGYIVTAAPKNGISTGIQYVYKLPDRNIGFFLGSDFIYNKPNDEYRDSVTNSIYTQILNIKKVPNYYNIPVTLGFDYQYPIMRFLSMDFNIALSLNFLKISDYVTSYETQKTDWSGSIGVKMGMGVILGNRISLDLNYFGLGKHSTTIRYIHQYSTDTTHPHYKVHFLTLTSGVWF